MLEARDARVEVLRRHGGDVLVRLCGDHDLSTKPRLLEALAAVRRTSGIVIDLTCCTFVDSTIIGAILHAARAGTHTGPRVSALIPSDTSYVYRALSVAGLRELLPAGHPIEAEREGRREAGESPGCPPTQ
jgi:anti-anti-sigma factor